MCYFPVTESFRFFLCSSFSAWVEAQKCFWQWAGTGTFCHDIQGAEWAAVPAALGTSTWLFPWLWGPHNTPLFAPDRFTLLFTLKTRAWTNTDSPCHHHVYCLQHRKPRSHHCHNRHHCCLSPVSPSLPKPLCLQKQHCLQHQYKPPSGGVNLTSHGAVRAKPSSAIREEPLPTHIASWFGSTLRTLE